MYTSYCRSAAKAPLVVILTPGDFNVIELSATGLVPLDFGDMPPVDSAARVSQLDDVTRVNRRVDLEEAFLRLYRCLDLVTQLVRLALVMDHGNP